MNLSFLVNPIYTYGKDGWDPDQEMLSGTEDSVVEWASRLQERGHEVIVYKNGEPTIYRGVPYRPREEYHARGVTINVCDSETRAIEPTIYFTTQTDIDRRKVDDYACIVFISQYAKAHPGVNHVNQEILTIGYDSSRIYPDKKIPNQCLYASSPDRGLDELLAVWPDVVRRVPSATLIVTYGVTGDLGSGVLALGDVDRETMDELYRTSDVWAYPCNGGELFCITGIKAQAAGAVPVYFPTMALQETVRHGVKSIPETFGDDLALLLADEERKEQIRHQLALEKYTTWEDSTDQLEALIEKYSGVPNR